MNAKIFFVYMMASKRNGAIYTGVTNNLLNRVWQHKYNIIQGFTSKYNVHKLVYYEQHEDIKPAINREKQIKKWKRQWKLKLIEQLNPYWKDLYEDIII